MTDEKTRRYAFAYSHGKWAGEGRFGGSLYDYMAQLRAARYVYRPPSVPLPTVKWSHVGNPRTWADKNGQLNEYMAQLRAARKAFPSAWGTFYDYCHADLPYDHQQSMLDGINSLFYGGQTMSNDTKRIHLTMAEANAVTMALRNAVRRGVVLPLGPEKLYDLADRIQDSGEPEGCEYTVLVLSTQHLHPSVRGSLKQHFVDAGWWSGARVLETADGYLVRLNGLMGDDTDLHDSVRDCAKLALAGGYDRIEFDRDVMPRADLRSYGDYEAKLHFVSPAAARTEGYPYVAAPVKPGRDYVVFEVVGDTEAFIEDGIAD